MVANFMKNVVFTTIKELVKLFDVSGSVSKKRKTELPRDPVNIIARVARKNADGEPDKDVSFKIKDSTGEVDLLVQGNIPKDLKPGVDIILYFCKMESGDLIFTKDSYVHVCPPELSKQHGLVKIDYEESTISTKEMEKMNNPLCPITDKTFYFKICEIVPVQVTKGGLVKTQRILCADHYHTFYIVFFNTAIEEYMPIFEKNVGAWVSVDNFTVTIYEGQPGVKLAPHEADIRVVSDGEKLKTLGNIPKHVQQEVDGAKGINVTGVIIDIKMDTFKSFSRCESCRKFLSPKQGRLCKAKDCVSNNATQVERGFSVMIALLSDNGDGVFHLRMNNEVLQTLFTLDSETEKIDVTRDNIGDIYPLKGKSIMATYKVAKKDRGDGKTMYVVSCSETEKTM